MGSFEKSQKMLSVVEIKANAAYFYFLRGLLYLLRILPTTYSKYILISAKALIGTLPFVWIGMLSVLTVVMQGIIGRYLRGSQNSQKKRSEAHQVEVNRLQECIAAEKDERLMLQRSSELLMECVKTLQKKLDTEIVTRRTYQRDTENEKKIQTKKIDSIETRLDKLKGNLKKGILGMDKVLQGIQMESPIRKSKGDYAKENCDMTIKKNPLVEIKN